jgi:pimeloyl-ACP methyl ester carboxylesterase
MSAVAAINEIGGSTRRRHPAGAPGSRVGGVAVGWRRYGSGVITFGLVHGAWHGAWCWDLVVGELHRRGHQTVAVDLPCEDPAAGAHEYARVVLDALGDADDVVMVGHSLGGLIIPVVAERLAERGRPASGMVFVAGLLPSIGASFDDGRADDPDRLMPGLGAGQIAYEDGSSSWQPQAAIATMYPDAPPELAEWAAARLRRQQWRVTQEVTPLRSWPAVPVTVVACGTDAVVNPDWVRRAARVRFGAEAVVLPGDHAPFLTRPAELVDVLEVASAADAAPATARASGAVRSSGPPPV